VLSYFLTIRAKCSEGKNMYKHAVVQPGFTEINRTRFFKMCKTILGEDRTKWSDHPDRDKVEELAHRLIYKQPMPYSAYLSGLKDPDQTALRLQLNFLLRAPYDLKKSKRQSCYEQVVASAIDAGVITADEVLSWR